ncbi:MAG: hypothetical protein WKF61_04740 [Luteimonas sp.]
MKEYFSDIRGEDAPAVREVKFNGKSRKVYFKRITAGERVQLVSGQKVQIGTKSTMEMDMGDLLKNRHLLVRFSACDEQGTLLFDSVAEVSAEPDWLVNQLAAHADAVNKDDDEPGKS